jgi:hypothetical protein
MHFSLLKKVDFFSKHVKFGLEVHFNMAITLDGWIGLLNSEMRDMAPSIKAFCT